MVNAAASPPRERRERSRAQPLKPGALGQAKLVTISGDRYAAPQMRQLDSERR